MQELLMPAGYDFLSKLSFSLLYLASEGHSWIFLDNAHPQE